MSDLKDKNRPRAEENSFAFWEEFPQDRPLWSLDFQSYHNLAAGAMTGQPQGHLLEEFGSVEKGSPRYWAVYGARIAGWSRIDRRQKIDYISPLRYSLPKDIIPIIHSVEAMNVGDVCDNVEQVIDADPEDHYGESARAWMREQAVPHLLPALRRFYAEAREDGDVVIHWLY